jgi:hypothetical protein
MLRLLQARQEQLVLQVQLEQQELRELQVLRARLVQQEL